MVASKFLEKRIKDRAKKVERSRARYEERVKAVQADKEARDREKDLNRRRKSR